MNYDTVFNNNKLTTTVLLTMEIIMIQFLIYLLKLLFSNFKF